MSPQAPVGQEPPHHALVVGASRGVGLGLTAEYLRRGWRVTATVRDPEGAPGLAALIEAAPHKVQCEIVDIAVPESVEGLALRLAGEIFDVVIVNAGIIGPDDQAIGNVSATDAANLFYTNALAPVHVAQKFVAQLRGGTGVVAFMSSRTGSVAATSNGTKPLYRASKAALNSLTRSLTAGLIDKSITVLSLHPGWVRTDMGGPTAAIDVATSARGLVDVIQNRVGTGGHAFLDYTGETIPW